MEHHIDTVSNKEREILDLQKLGFKNMLVFGHYRYKQVRRELKTHVHRNMIEICYLKTGIQHYSIEGKNYCLRAGDILVIPPNKKHDSSGYPEDKGTLYWLIFSIPEGNKTLLNLSLEETQYVITQLLKLETIGLRKKHLIDQWLNEIFTIYNSHDDTLKKIKTGNLILGFILTIINPNSISTIDGLSPTMKKICDYIDNHIENEFNLEALSDMCYLSLSRFKHRFKSELGIPPKDYILRKKIEISKFMLKKKLPITQISYDLGFSNSGYFATCFKRYANKTPSQFIQEELRKTDAGL